jgi:hypothetical protein
MAQCGSTQSGAAQSDRAEGGEGAVEQEIETALREMKVSRWRP